MIFIFVLRRGVSAGREISNVVKTPSHPSQQNEQIFQNHHAVDNRNKSKA